MLAQAGCRCEIRRSGVGAAHRLRRTMAMVDLVEGLAARHAAAGLSARAVIYSSITGALLQPLRQPHAIRFDTLAVQSRPGVTGLWQRRREPAVLARARLLLPWGETAAAQARAVLAGAGDEPAIVTLPVPIEPLPGAAQRDLDAVAYCANPAKRGLDILCAAWRAAAPSGGRLVIGGIDKRRALAYLDEAGVREAPGITWAGAMPRPRWLEHVARARIYVNASHYEDWGIGPLEALSAGTPLVTVASRGPNEALPLARRLAPALVSDGIEAAGLAGAITAGLALGDVGRADYAGRADAALAPYRPEAVRRILTERVLPALLASSV